MALRRRAITSVLAAVAAVGFTVVPATAADTQGPLKNACSGYVLDDWPLVDNGRTVGRLELWRDGSAPGGQNCVITYNFLPGKVETAAALFVDDNDTGRIDGNDRASFDIGPFESYAGASYRNYTNGHCVKALGYVKGNGYNAIHETAVRWCG